MSRHVVAKAADIAPGGSKIVVVNGREIGIFNVAGEFFALSNRCPHEAGPLCAGKITGIVLSDGPGEYPRLGIRHPHRPVLVRSEIHQSP
jgi:3-phenylpropionate/trans-cinnamate dioxygenase ferredoxin subunit